MERKKTQILLLLFISLLLLAGCQSGGADAGEVEGPTPTVDPVIAFQAAIQATIAAEESDRAELIAQWLEDLDEAQAAWEASPVENYTISVIFTPQTTVNQSLYTITVENGEITNQTSTCAAFGTNANCIVDDIDYNNVTIPGLFGMAQNALANDMINQDIPLDFHEEYGFPQFIALQSSGQFPWFWQVTSFQPTE